MTSPILPPSVVVYKKNDEYPLVGKTMPAVVTSNSNPTRPLLTTFWVISGMYICRYINLSTYAHQQNEPEPETLLKRSLFLTS